MSSAEPFMPAHRPPPGKADAEWDIDHDEDVIFDEDDGSEPGPVVDREHEPPPFRTPVPGAHMSHAEMHDDFPESEDDEFPEDEADAPADGGDAEA